MGGGKAVFGLSSALRSLGLPCQLPARRTDLTLDIVTAAEMLERAFTRKTTVRRHLCPLDLADDLPLLTFGGSRVAPWLRPAPRAGERYYILVRNLRPFENRILWIVSSS